MQRVKSYIKNPVFLMRLLSFLVIVIPLISLLHPEFFRVHDYTQGARIVEMFRGFQDGQIPVRWSQNFGFGYGMPTFLFYGPFPYIVGAGVYWLTKDLVFSLKFIWALPSIFSFIGMYVFTKKYVGKWGAVIAATSFTLAPYRAVDLYVRGAIGEVWGIAFFPWILIAVDEWFDRPLKISPKLSVLTGLLLITHNLMAMFFLPVVAVYGLLKWFFAEKRKIRTLFFFVTQLVIGLGLSAFFIFPALLEKDQTQIQQRILSGYFSYTQHFVYIRQFFQENWKYGGSVWGPSDDISFFLGYGQLLGLLLLVVLSLYWCGIHFIKRKHSLRKQLGIYIQRYRNELPLILLASTFLPISLFLTLQRSEFVWKLSTLLQTAQFPWRFLSLSIFCLAILNGFILHFRLEKRTQIVVFTTLFIVLVVPSVKYFQPERFLDHAQALYYADPHRIRFEMSGTWPDFLPINFNSKLPPTDVRYQLSEGSNPKDVEVTIDRTSQLAVQTHFSAPTQLTLNIADFPGWSIFINGKETSFAQTKDGLIQVLVPSGDQFVSVELERTPVRLVADIITLMAGALVVSQYIIFRRRVQ